MFAEETKKIALNLAIDSERFVVGLGGRDAKRNGLMNYERALQYVEAIVTSRPWRGENHSKCRVLNLSGVNAGQCDLVMVTLLKSVMYEPLEWISYDSELNIHLQNKWLINKFDDNGIQLRFADFGLENYFQDSIKYDIVLLTEVIEHLDYSDALRLIHKSIEKLNSNGIILLSIPNPQYLLDRFKFFIGMDPWFDTNIKSHLDNKYYGHVNIYTETRITNILHSLGFSDFKIFSINHWRYSFSDAPIKFLVQKILDIIKIFIPFSGFTLVAVAKKN
jgi:hypothetical protein